MKFSECEAALKEGKKIKLSKWENAYWYVNSEGELTNVCEGGEEISVTEIFPLKVMSWIESDEWEICPDDFVSHTSDKDTITISKADFKKALDEIMHEEMAEGEDGKPTNPLIVIVGGIFIKKLERKLFNEKEEN